ncbi:MAG: hypothetical protein J0L93_08310 [Deltaproteobacteria bacterium]|nr:hypothetical protein [Deltaproteobacteria bacterium]
MSYATDILDYLSRWKLADTVNLAAGAFPNKVINQNTYSVTLKRLRRDKLIASHRLGDLTVHFDHAIRNRSNYVARIPKTERRSFLSRSGIDHHLKIQRLSNQLEKLLIGFKFSPNPNDKTLSTTDGRVGESGRKFIPDLIAEPTDQLDRLIFVEVERTLKADRRYFEKWEAYETDQNLFACLYVVYDRVIELQLKEKLRRYFSGARFGSSSFAIGILQADKIEEDKSRAVVTRFEKSKESEVTLYDFFPRHLISTG